MTKEEEQKIYNKAEKLFLNGNALEAYEILEKVFSDREEKGLLTDDYTAILMGKILLAGNIDYDRAKGIVNQLSQTDNLKVFVNAIDIGSKLEKMENGKIAAYSFVYGMRKEWLSRKGNYIPTYYDSKFSIMMAEYTTNDTEREELLKSVIEKGYKKIDNRNDSNDIEDNKINKYDAPNDVYVKASRKLIKMYLYNSRIDEALELCDKYLEYFDSDYHVLFSKAQALLSLDKSEEAREILSKIDTTRIKDKKFIERIESLKGSIEKNSTTMEEIKENYFGEISFSYEKGKVILPPDEGEPKGKKRKTGRRKRANS